MPALPRLRNPMPHIEHAIHKALEERRRDQRSSRPRGLYLSELGACPRKLWALLQGHPDEPIPGNRLAIFEMGNSVEDLVIRLLQHAGYIIVRKQERVVLRFGDGVEASGRMDGVILLPRTRSRFEEAVLEIKSANEEQFAQCATLGYDAWHPTYGDTLHAYMGASGLDTAVAVVFCKNNSRVYAEKIRLDENRYKQLRDKAELILRAEKPPTRPLQATSQSSEFCKWCPTADWCWSAFADIEFDP